MTVSVSPRVELLGVVQYLAGLHPPGPDIPSYLESVERHFGSFKNHPCVRSYARAAGRDAYGWLVLFWSDPPALEWAFDVKLAPMDYIRRAGGREAVNRFRGELRDFARVSDFDGFSRSQRAAYLALADEVRGELGEPDPFKAVEDYVGPLEARFNLILSPLFRSNDLSYIIPYPAEDMRRAVPGPFTVFSLVEPRSIREGKPLFSTGSFWSEPLRIAIDRSLVRYREQFDRLGGLYPSMAGECPGPWSHCAAHLISRAVQSRLENQARSEAGSTWADTPFGRAGAALASRLREYERRRDSFKSLEDFFPSLLETLRELPVNSDRGGKESSPHGPSSPLGGDSGGARPKGRAQEQTSLIETP